MLLLGGHVDAAAAAAAGTADGLMLQWHMQLSTAAATYC
jgi:hypothetical protein